MPAYDHQLESIQVKLDIILDRFNSIEEQQRELKRIIVDFITANDAPSQAIVDNLTQQLNVSANTLAVSVANSV